MKADLHYVYINVIYIHVKIYIPKPVMDTYVPSELNLISRKIDMHTRCLRFLKGLFRAVL